MMRAFFSNLIVCCIAVCSAHAAEPIAPPINLLKNPSFEGRDDKPAAWVIGGGPLFLRDTAVSRSGRSSLRWDNDDPENYKLATQQVRLKAGRSYELSAWIKTEGIAGVRESGATIALGYGGHDGEHIKGGPHPGGQQGTGDWWRLVSYTGPIPAEVSHGTFTCYVRKNGPTGKTFTGTAWWDDVALRPVSMKVQMLEPVYKSRVTDESSQLSLKVTTWPEDFGLHARDVRIRVRVASDSESDAVAFEEVFPFDADSGNGSTVFTADLHGLAPGRYGVQIDMLNAGTGQILWQTRREIRRVAQPVSELWVHVDKHRRLVVDGKPFFPIGLYVRKAPVDLLAGTPFNCFMSYDELSATQMDEAHAAGLKVIYSVKDYFNSIWHSPSSVRSVHDEVPAIRSIVRSFRDHPALLGWYVNDELGPANLEQHRAHYSLLNEEDPNHPAWSLHHKTYEMADLMDTADIMGIDSYPVPTEPLSKVAADTLATQQGIDRMRPVWTAPQVFDWSMFGQEGRPPTLDEMRNMAWQAICHDARGLIFYSLHHVQRDKGNPFDVRWQDIKTMAGEVDEYSEVLLSVEDLPEIQVAQEPWLHWTARRLGNEIYLFAVSVEDGGGDVEFSVDLDVKAVERHRFGDDLSKTHELSTGNRWEDRFAPCEVRVYKITLRE